MTRAGKNGKKKVTYRVTYVDGKEESRKVIKEEVLVKPVAQIVTQGTKSRPSSKIRAAAEMLSYRSRRYMIVTVQDTDIILSNMQTER